MSVYDNKPERLFDLLPVAGAGSPGSCICCAGFELGKWRTEPLAMHLIEWLPDYALAEDELRLHHGNAYVKLREAAVRVYTSNHYERRGEPGEIALHAVCRDFFNTVPIAPRVFYKSSSNDPVKSFDLVHARFPGENRFEIWLGEAKFYTDSAQAIAAAIASVTDHIRQGFLTREKLLLGPQISRTTPHYEDVMKVFRTQTSIDEFLKASVFVIGILSDSPAVQAASAKCDAYVAAALAELNTLLTSLNSADFGTPLRLLLVYVPLASKAQLAEAFDKRLKGLQ